MSRERDAGAGGDMVHEALAEYDRARVRLERRRRFGIGVLVYVVVNAGLVLVWALTGFGPFWPGWVLAVWGAGLILAALNLLHFEDMSDEDIRRELRGGR